MSKLFEGIIPTKDATEIARTGQWLLFELPRITDAPNAAEYRNYKLVSIKPRPKKANFRIAYHLPRKDWVPSNDLRAIVEHEPALFSWAVDQIRPRLSQESPAHA